MAYKAEDLGDFWQQYPDAGLVPEFAALREKRADRSSELMWYIKLMHDPSHEFMRHIPAAEREPMLKKALRVVKSDTETAFFKAAEEAMRTRFCSPAHRQVSLLREKLHSADRVLTEAEMFHPNDIKEILGAMQARGQMVKEYEDAVRAMAAHNGVAKAEREKLYGGKGEEVRPSEDGSMF